MSDQNPFKGDYAGVHTVSDAEWERMGLNLRTQVRALLEQREEVHFARIKVCPECNGPWGAPAPGPKPHYLFYLRWRICRLCHGSVKLSWWQWLRYMLHR